MAIVCTEYDRESFLDEYSSLCNATITPRRTKLEQFRRRCFSEMPMTNNPLSKFRHRSKKPDKIETRFVPKRTVSLPDENSERDSGYFSIDPDEKVYFISGDGEQKWGDLEPFIDDDEEPITETASSFAKKRTKFLLHKHNIKLNIGKTKENVTSTKTVTIEDSNNNSVNKDNKVAPRSRKLSWKRAKKRASIVVRFIKRESKGEDEVSLLRTASIRSTFSPIDRTTPECVVQDYEESNKTPEIEKKIFDDTFTLNNLSNHQTIVSPFDDSFIIVEENNIVSPLDLKYLRPRNISRERPRCRPRSLSYNGTTNYTSETETGNNNADFVEKYLNRSHSLDFSDIREIDSDNHLEHSFFPDDDFEPDSTVYCEPNEVIEENNENRNENRNEKNIIHKKERLSHGEFETIVEEEVDNYILTDYQDNEECFDNVKHIGSLSYSVNNLYDLLNREKLFNYDCTLDGLLV